MTRRFVGRARELADLRQGLREAFAGRGQAFLVGGEAGIGKTRLAEVILAEAEEQGGRPLWGRCWEASGAPPYWPWIQVVRTLLAGGRFADLAGDLGPGAGHLARLVPELAPSTEENGGTLGHAADPEQERFLLFDAATGFLRRAAAAAPLAIAIEDAHAADLSSLLLLQFIARSLGDTPVILVVTYREIEARRAGYAAAMLGELASVARGISLSGLNKAEIAELVEETLGGAAQLPLVETLFRTTAGNPFFLDELLEAFVARGNLGDPTVLAWHALGVPDRVRQAIRRRLEPLSESCSAMVTAAAVLGDEFGVSLLDRVIGLGTDALLAVLGEAVEAGVITRTTGRPGRYRFVHSLVREAIHAELSPGQIVRLHRKAAEALEDVRPSAPYANPSELAYHHFEVALATGEVERAVHWCVRAGEHARAQMAFEQAVYHFERALQAIELSDLPEGDQACELTLACAEARACAGNRAEADEGFRRAASMARRLGNARLFARAALGFERQWFFVVEIGKVSLEVVQLLEEALALLADDSPELRALVAARLAMELHFSPDRSRCDTLSQQATELARSAGDPAALATVLLARHTAIWGPDRTEEQRAIADEALALAQTAGARDLVLTARWFRYLSLLDLGETGPAETEFASLARRAGESQRPAWLWICSATRAMRLFVAGRLEEAARAAEEAFALGRQAQPRNAALAFDSQIAIIRREQRRAIEVIDSVQVLADLYPSIAALQFAAAWTYAETGDPGAAWAKIARLDSTALAEIPRDALWMAGMVVATECCWTLGAQALAAEIYPLLLPYARRCAVGSLGVVVFGSVSRSLGQLAALCGNFDEADRHFKSAVAENARMGCVTWGAHAAHEWAAMLVRRSSPGDFDRASQLLEGAKQKGEELGLNALSARIEALEEWMGLAVLGEDLELSNRIAPPPGAVLLPGPASRGVPSPWPAGIAAEVVEGRRPALGPEPPSEPERLFRREGEYWTIRSHGKTCRLRHCKGLGYLATLLQHPGREFHSLELASLLPDPTISSAAEEAVRTMSRAQLQHQGLHSVGSGDAGELLDARAQSAYKVRLRELDLALSDAEAACDANQSTRLREEIEFLAREVTRAVGLADRSRRAGSPAERARINVTRAVKSAIEKLSQANPPLGRHLSRTVRTGSLCQYVSDPDAGPGWTF